MSLGKMVLVVSYLSCHCHSMRAAEFEVKIFRAEKDPAAGRP